MGMMLWVQAHVYFALACLATELHACSQLRGQLHVEMQFVVDV